MLSRLTAFQRSLLGIMAVCTGRLLVYFAFNSFFSLSDIWSWSEKVIFFVMIVSGLILFIWYLFISFRLIKQHLKTSKAKKTKSDNAAIIITLLALVSLLQFILKSW